MNTVQECQDGGEEGRAASMTRGVPMGMVRQDVGVTRRWEKEWQQRAREG